MSVTPFRREADGRVLGRWKGKGKAKEYVGLARVPDGGGSWLTDTSDQIAALSYVCPCGCRASGAITVYREGQTNPPKGWKWNGDMDRPTLTPSIQRIGGCRWHGFLTDGEWRQV